MKKAFQLLKKPSTILFARYFACAAIATIVDFAALFSLTEFLELWYVYSVAIAYIAGMITNYSLNRHFTFKSNNSGVALQFGKFFAVAILGLAINQAIIFALVEYAKVWYLLGKAVATITVLAYSFYSHKTFTFK